MKSALLLSALIIFAAYLYSTVKSKYEASKYLFYDISYGPFTIKVSGKPIKNEGEHGGKVYFEHVTYKVFHDGKPVDFPNTENNTKHSTSLNMVMALSGTPVPTLLVAGQAYYLLFLENGVPVVEQIPLMYSLQFLDSQNGQPGPRLELFRKAELADLDKLDTYEGGRYLMISKNIMIDLQTHKTWDLNKNNQAVENYSFPQPEHALALSPNEKCIVFNAAFQTWNAPEEDCPDSEHALVVYDFAEDSGYLVKYDDTDTRLTSWQDVDSQWFNAYFEWKKSSTGDRLQLRKFEKLPNWTGRFSEEGAYYTLYPVKPGMLAVFLDFVLSQMGWSKDNILEEKSHEYTGHCFYLGSGTTKVDVVFKEDEQTLSFSKHLYDDKTPENIGIVKKIGDAFEAELSEGKHQEHFGRIIRRKY